jgi:hypothetical protein
MHETRERAQRIRALGPLGRSDGRGVVPFTAAVSYPVNDLPGIAIERGKLLHPRA